MIIDGLLVILIGLVEFLLDLLPDWNVYTTLGSSVGTLDPAFPLVSGDLFVATVGGAAPTAQNAFTWLFTMAWHYNYFLPIDHFLSILTFVSGAWLIFVGYRLFKWIVGVIRGAGTE